MHFFFGSCLSLLKWWLFFLARALGARVGGALLGTVGEDARTLSADSVTTLLAGLGRGRTTARGVLAHFCVFLKELGKRFLSVRKVTGLFFNGSWLKGLIFAN
jgi:hypothetical protein